MTRSASSRVASKNTQTFSDKPGNEKKRPDLCKEAGPLSVDRVLEVVLHRKLHLSRSRPHIGDLAKVAGAHIAVRVG